MSRAIGGPALVAFLVFGGVALLFWRSATLRSAASEGTPEAEASVSAPLRVDLATTGQLMQNVAGPRTGEDRNELYASPGQRIEIDYNAKVARGRLALQVSRVGAAAPVWLSQFETDRRDRVTIAVPAPGNYEVIARMTGFGGEYQLKWEIR
jgi:hypothetical protein